MAAELLHESGVQVSATGDGTGWRNSRLVRHDHVEPRNDRDVLAERA
jgi:hypothetical protein